MALDETRARNKAAGLASILLSTDRHYIHLIEGHRTDVNRLYNKINRDENHFDCTLLRYIEIKKREFNDWHAEYAAMSEFDVGDINLLLPSGDIDISTISSAQAVTMIRRIYAHIQVKNS